MKRIAILGSTGSIGTQTLSVLEKLEGFEVVAMSCGHNFSLFEEQISKLRPRFAASVGRCERLIDKFSEITFFSGESGIEEMLEASEVDYAVIAVSGATGLRFSVKAAEVAKRICLANKESLVCGGVLLRKRCKEKSVELIPVDSEHSGLFQLIEGGIRPEKIFITASGGALRDREISQMQNASLRDVLNHPVWSMGSRVTIDSASMVNKGLEIIEAHYLFGYEERDIETYICRNSYIHAGVSFADGMVKLHVGIPDMRVPIAYSLTYPYRERILDHEEVTSVSLKLEPIKSERYPALCLARAICGRLSEQIAFNAADEIAVEAFAQERIRFGDIYNIIEKTVSAFRDQKPVDYSQILEIDRLARKLARKEVQKCY